MRAWRQKTIIEAVDKASKVINNIYTSAKRMSSGIAKDSAIAGSAFNRFTSAIGIGVKKASLHLNNLNARVNRIGRNIKNSLGTLGLAVGFTAITMLAGNTIKKFADFEQANANLASVMATATQPELNALQIDAKRLGAITARTSTEVVGLQESLARLGFETPDILKMTQSIISGSVAMQGELSDTADLVGAMIKSFDAFEPVHTVDIVDQMTVATQKSALNFEKLQTMLPTVAGAANAAGIPFNKLLALLGKLSDAGIDASSSATALRNIILQSSAKGRDYEGILQDIVSQQDKLTTSMNEFGVRAAVPATVLAGKLNETLTLSEDILNSTGAAAAAEAKTLNTLTGSVTILGSAWEGFILSLEDGKGAFSGFLKDVVKTATEILSMATGTAKAKEEMTAAELRIRGFAETAITVLKVIKNIAIAFVGFKVAVLALRAAVFVTKVVTTAYNIALGIQTALLNKNIFALRGNKIALIAMNVSTKAMAAATAIYNMGLSGAIAATLAFTAALLTNPITWIVVGIGALIAGIVLLVKHFDKVKTAVKNAWQAIENNRLLQLLILPIYTTVKAIQFLIQGVKYLINNFDAVKAKMSEIFKTITSNPIAKLLLFPIYLTVSAIKLLVHNFGTIKEVFINVFNSVMGLFSSIGNFFASIGRLISAVFNYAFDVVVGKLQNVWQSFKAFFIGVGNFASKLAEPFKPIIAVLENIGSAIGTFIIDKFKQIGEFVSKIIDAVSAFFNRGTEKINAKTEQIITLNQKATKQDVSKTVVNDIEKQTISETTKNKVIENEAIKTNASDKLTDAMLLNAKLTDENTEIQKANKGEWKGKFKTYVVKNENIVDRNISNEIAKTAILNEKNVINQQKSVLNEKNLQNEISQNIVNKETSLINKTDFVKESDINNISNTEFSTQKELVKQKEIENVKNETNTNNVNRNNQKQELTIYVVDKTGNRFAVEVEGTGINVKRTGNA